MDIDRQALLDEFTKRLEDVPADSLPAVYVKAFAAALRQQFVGPDGYTDAEVEEIARVEPQRLNRTKSRDGIWSFVAGLPRVKPRT